MIPIRRRHLLAAAAAAPLAGCVTPQEPAPGPPSPVPTTPSPVPSPTATHPFGLQAPGRVEAVIFDGAFGVGYVRDAAAAVRTSYDKLVVQIRASSDIAADVGPRFEAGATPPDLIDNSGAGQLALAGIADDLLALDDLLLQPNLQGETIAETLYSGVVEAGTVNGRLVALNYALSVYGLWHSASRFAAEGWAVPVAWDELLLFGEERRAAGEHLFVWGDEAANYYAELAISSAVKEGGDEVRKALENLTADAWSHPAVAGVLAAMETCVTEGFVLHGGSYLDAQALWSAEQRALFYPSGSWIAGEMLDRTAAGFEMSVAPVPTLTAAPTLPLTAIHAQPTESFVVPKNAANPGGGLELLRVMLSREVAGEFARAHLVPTVVRGSVPAGEVSTALSAQTRLLADAGEDVFALRFVSHYGFNDAYNRLWGEFLGGTLSAALLAEQLQALSDAVREDPAVEKYTVS